jgi:hypothetical protein
MKRTPKSLSSPALYSAGGTLDSPTSIIGTAPLLAFAAPADQQPPWSTLKVLSIWLGRVVVVAILVAMVVLCISSAVEPSKLPRSVQGLGWTDVDEDIAVATRNLDTTEEEALPRYAGSGSGTAFSPLLALSYVMVTGTMRG